MELAVDLGTGPGKGLTGCRSGGRGQGISDSHHTFQSLPRQKHRTSAQLSYYFNHGSSRTKSARPCETGSELGGIRGVCRAAEAGLPLSQLRVEAPFPVRLRGASGRKGIGWSRGCGSPSQRWHRSAGAGDPCWRDPVPSPGDPGAAARGGAEGRRELPGGSQGRCFAGRYRGSAPVRGAGRPPAGRANHRGPMTTRPNPSRLGSRDATQGEPAATLVL